MMDIDNGYELKIREGILKMREVVLTVDKGLIIEEEYPLISDPSFCKKIWKNIEQKSWNRMRSKWKDILMRNNISE